MEGSLNPSCGSVPATSPVLVHISQCSREDTLRESTTSTKSFHRTLLNCFSSLFLQSKRSNQRHTAPSSRFSEPGYFRGSSVSTISVDRMEPDIEALPYRWPHDGSFDPKTTALIIIDMQMDCKYMPFNALRCLFASSPSHFRFILSSLWSQILSV